MGICSERAWPASQCREHERRLAAETLELATVGPYGCIVGVGAGECTSAIEPIPSCVCAKLLMQYGPGRMSDLLPVVLDVRADRVEAQAPIMPVARAAMHQRGTM